MSPEELQAYVDNRIDARLEDVAQRAADKAIEKVYAQIGRGLVVKAMWVTGVLLLTLLSWMAGKGMKLPSP